MVSVSGYLKRDFFVESITLSINHHIYIGPLLDDRLKENLKNPETLKGCPLYSLSCLSVCLRATEHTFWPRNLIFGLKDPWDMRKKRNFLFFEILKNGIFRTIFTFLSVCLRATEDTFWPRNLIFGLKGPWDMRKKRIFLFFEILKNGIFRAIFTQKVCLRATEHTFWPRNLIFGLKDPWDMRKKRIFFCFSEF